MGSAAGGLREQQKGSKRRKLTLRNHAQFSAEHLQTRMNRAIARQSSPIVVSMEQACHAEVADSSPVAPVENPCKSANFVVTSENVIAHSGSKQSERDACRAVIRRRSRREPARIVVFR
jgi:hypothetical protein